MELKLICFLVSTRMSGMQTYQRPGYKIFPDGLTGKRKEMDLQK